MVVGGLEEDVGCSEPDEGEPTGPLPVLLSGSSSLMVSAVVEDTDEPPDEGGVLGSRGGDVFRLSCCRWGGIWSEGVEDDEEDSEDEDEDEDDEDEDDEEDGVGGARVGVEGVGGSSIAVGLFPSPPPPPVPLVVLEELLLRLPLAPPPPPPPPLPLLADEEDELVRIVWWLLYGLKLLL